LRIAGQRLKSAKGAARTAERIGNWLAPRSVLRMFLKVIPGQDSIVGKRPDRLPAVEFQARLPFYSTERFSPAASRRKSRSICADGRR
jgi:lipopolysaccharide/colanic/teichoic acid biosynthesis glycosyltransferase